MKRSLFAILAFCVITVVLVGCSGDEAEIPDGHTADDLRKTPDAPAQSPSVGVGDTVKGD